MDSLTQFGQVSVAPIIFVPDAVRKSAKSNLGKFLGVAGTRNSGPFSATGVVYRESPDGNAKIQSFH